MSRHKAIKDPYTSRTYQQEAVALGLDFAPEIYPCAKCRHPVARGYCCHTCGTGTPETLEKDDE